MSCLTHPALLSCSPSCVQPHPNTCACAECTALWDEEHDEESVRKDAEELRELNKKD